MSHGVIKVIQWDCHITPTKLSPNCYLLNRTSRTKKNLHDDEFNNNNNNNNNISKNVDIDAADTIRFDISISNKYERYIASLRKRSDIDL